MLTFFEYQVACAGYDACLISCNLCPYELGETYSSEYSDSVCCLATREATKQIPFGRDEDVEYRAWEIMESFFTYAEGEI